MFYNFFIRKILFLLNPEFAHNVTIVLVKFAFLIPGFKLLINRLYSIDSPRLKKDVFGLLFKNPVGLAAGFDKNAKVFNEFASFGFGFIEIGTVTPKPQLGQVKPRLFRLIKDNAIINRMGFNNDGVDVIVKRLRKRNTNIIIGGNIGKNKITPNNSAVDDYIKCFDLIAPHVDYLVLNVSSPNTPNLRDLQKKDDLKILLTQIQNLNKLKYNKPVLIKISPDLTFTQIDEIILLVKEYDISGLITTNTTSSRHSLITNQDVVSDLGSGGLSGKPLYARSKEIVSYIHQKSNGNIPIIAVGGVMSADDAIGLLNAGASLIQVYTGFVYKGPTLIKEINQRLLNV